MLILKVHDIMIVVIMMNKKLEFLNDIVYQLDEMFLRYPEDEILEDIIPNSRFVSIDGESPYVLGAITPEVLSARQELMDLQRKLKKKESDYEKLCELTIRWEIEIKAWISVAIELGLLEETSRNMKFEAQLVLLQELVKANTEEKVIKGDGIIKSSEEMIILREKENELVIAVCNVHDDGGAYHRVDKTHDGIPFGARPGQHRGLAAQGYQSERAGIAEGVSLRFTDGTDAIKDVFISYDGENLPFENYIKIDNTTLAPDEVAKMIQTHFAIEGRKE